MMSNRSRVFLAVVFCISLLGTACQVSTRHQPRSGQAAVATPDQYGTNVAARILARGGNAVDAAVATAFALAVTYPEAGNIGGGGFMLIHYQGKSDFLDYREKAPGTAHRDMFLDDQGDVVPNLSLVGHKASGVPGTVAGMWAAHQKYGSMPWPDLLAPAIELAKGHRVPQVLVEKIGEEILELKDQTNFAKYFSGLEPDQLFVQSDLSATLQRIADHGRDGFYKSKTADLIVAEMNSGGGLISYADLATFQAQWREPLKVSWRNHEIVTAPLPSSGGFAVVQLLKMKDFLESEFHGLEHNSAQYVHLVAEMEKRVFADRAEYLGDPDFVDVPAATLVDEAYIEKRAREVSVSSISQLDSIRPGIEGHSTTHFSIVDAEGNAVANTYTLNTWFGSKVVVNGAGFLLNNEMDDFSAKPGAANYFGVVGASANAIEPGKKMLSSMTPTILLRNGSPAMVLGSPGGSTIFTSVFQAIVNILDFQMTAQDAVSVARFHHQLLPPTEITMSVCCPLPARTQTELKIRGYDPKPHAWEFGDLQVIWRDETGNLELGSDPRGRGTNKLLTVTQ